MAKDKLVKRVITQDASAIDLRPQTEAEKIELKNLIEQNYRDFHPSEYIKNGIIGDPNRCNVYNKK